MSPVAKFNTAVEGGRQEELVIDVNDIIAKLIRLSPGDICKIKRINNKCGENYFYRVCK